MLNILKATVKNETPAVRRIITPLLWSIKDSRIRLVILRCCINNPEYNEMRKDARNCAFYDFYKLQHKPLDHENYVEYRMSEVELEIYRHRQSALTHLMSLLIYYKKPYNTSKLVELRAHVRFTKRPFNYAELQD